MRRFSYLHIPKTAGTSFTAALHSVLEVSPSFDPHFRMEADTARQLDTHTIVSGHLSYSDYIRWFSDRAAFTILRDPVDRCLSWYWYCRNVVPDGVNAPDVVSAKHLSPKAYFAQDRSVIFRVVNSQTQQLGGHLCFPDPDEGQVVSRAKAMLEKMIWIGLAESLECDAARLREIPEFATLPRIERTNSASRDFEICAAVRQQVEAINQGDIELYEYAKKLIATG